MELRDYNKENLKVLKEHIKKNKKTLIVMACGLGKTVLMAHIIRYLVKKGQKALYLCDKTDILDQAVDKIQGVATFRNCRRFIPSGDDWQDADVLFASFKAMNNSQNQWMKMFYKNEFDYIFVDESHHSYARTYSEVLNYFKPKRIIGATATPYREDEKDIGDFFGDPVIDISMDEALENGWLTPIHYQIFTDTASDDYIKKLESLEVNITLESLNKNLFIDSRDIEIVRRIREVAKKRRTVVFGRSIKHIERFKTHMPEAVLYHSKLPVKLQKKIFSDFIAGKIQTLLTIEKLHEGVDAVDVEVLVILRDTSSKRISEQRVGRGLRIKPGKNIVDILDFTESCERLMLLQRQFERMANEEFDFEKGEESYVISDNIKVSFRGKSVDIAKYLKNAKRLSRIQDLPPEELLDLVLWCKKEFGCLPPRFMEVING
jgi:superfamily II DNA or RNA helicase